MDNKEDQSNFAEDFGAYLMTILSTSRDIKWTIVVIAPSLELSIEFMKEYCGDGDIVISAQFVDYAIIPVDKAPGSRRLDPRLFEYD